MASLFSKLRLSHKIGAIGAAGVVGLLTVGAIYFVGNATQNGYRATAEDAGAIDRASDQSSILLLDARRAEKDAPNAASRVRVSAGENEQLYPISPNLRENQNAALG